MSALNGLTGHGYTRYDQDADEARYRAIRQEHEADARRQQADEEKQIRRAVLLRGIAQIEARVAEREA